MKTDNHIILFGDLKGTKNYLLTADQKKLEDKLSTIHQSFSLSFMSFFDRSRNLSCYTFSDSVLAKWTDYREGIIYCLPFALEFWRGINPMPYRILIDCGMITNEKLGYSKLTSSMSNRYTNITPVSCALWSVSTAEASHFPEGIFVGKKLAEELSTKYKFGKDIKAGMFRYRQLLFP